MKEQIFENINTIFKLIDSHRSDPVKLLADANRLLHANSELGDLYVKARQEADLLEVDYKIKLDESFKAYRSDGVAIEEAKALARIDHQGLLKTLTAFQGDVLLYQVKRNDISEKVSVIQSYCSHLRDLYMREGRMNKL